MGTAKAIVKGDTQKFLSIRELEQMKEDTSIFVVNESPQHIRADILFEAPQLNGDDRDIIKVIKTWIPQDLTEQAPKEQILRSSNFRKTVSKGYVKILHPEYAEKLLATADAQEERSRISNLESHAKAVIQSQTITEASNNEEAVRRRKMTKEERYEEDERINSESKFDIFLGSLDGKTETQVLNALRNEGSFKRKQVKKISAKFEGFTRVQKWATKMLQTEE